jgi:hypothetical protein
MCFLTFFAGFIGFERCYIFIVINKWKTALELQVAKWMCLSAGLPPSLEFQVAHRYKEADSPFYEKPQRKRHRLIPVPHWL